MCSLNIELCIFYLFEPQLFSIAESLIWVHKCRLGNNFWFLCSIIIRVGHLDEAHSDTFIRLHIYPIPKSAWEKIRMANSNDNVLIGVSKEGRGAGIATKQLVLPFYQIISLWDAALRWKENLSSFNCLRFSFGGTDWTGKAPTSNFSTWASHIL